MTYSEIIHLVSQELNLSEELVNNTYKAYWLAIRNMIKDLPLKEDISTEEFSRLKTNFNIPSLGKLYCSEQHFKNAKKRMELIKSLAKDGNIKD